jgi:hypothetical protein
MIVKGFVVVVGNIVEVVALVGCVYLPRAEDVSGRDAHGDTSRKEVPIQDMAEVSERLLTSGWGCE